MSKRLRRAEPDARATLFSEKLHEREQLCERRSLSQLLLSTQIPSQLSQHPHHDTMKLLAVVSSALVASTATAEMCTVPQLTAIMSTQYTMPCMTESGLDFTKLSGTPSQALMMKFCKSSACQSLLKAVLAQNPLDCTVPMTNLLFRSQLFDPIATYCDASSASGTVNAGDAGAASNATKTTTHGASNSSSNGTHADNGTGTGNGNGNGTGTGHGNSSSSTAIEGQTNGGSSLLGPTSDGSLSDADVGTPAASTKAPTPTPKSGAASSSFAVSACAGVLGAVALIWVM